MFLFMVINASSSGKTAHQPLFPIPSRFLLSLFRESASSPSSEKPAEKAERPRIPWKIKTDWKCGSFEFGWGNEQEGRRTIRKTETRSATSSDSHFASGAKSSDNYSAVRVPRENALVGERITSPTSPPSKGPYGRSSWIGNTNQNKSRIK